MDAELYLGAMQELVQSVEWEKARKASCSHAPAPIDTSDPRLYGMSERQNNYPARLEQHLSNDEVDLLILRSTWLYDSDAPHLHH